MDGMFLKSTYPQKFGYFTRLSVIGKLITVKVIQKLDDQLKPLMQRLAK